MSAQVDVISENINNDRSLNMKLEQLKNELSNKVLIALQFIHPMGFTGMRNVKQFFFNLL